MEYDIVYIVPSWIFEKSRLILSHIYRRWQWQKWVYSCCKAKKQKKKQIFFFSFILYFGWEPSDNFTPIYNPQTFHPHSQSSFFSTIFFFLNKSIFAIQMNKSTSQPQNISCLCFHLGFCFFSPNY